MVQIKVGDEEKPESSTEEALQDSVDDDMEAECESDDQPRKEVPLKNMKKEDLIDRLNETQASADQNYELYLRSQAEIENLKKRFQKDKSDLVKFSNESLIKQLLGVIDNLEKAISATEDENPIDALKQGIELTLKGLMDALEKSGLSEVEANGVAFDPNFHEAISEMQDDQAEPGTVIQVLQKGYVLNDRLIRPAMVIVSKNN